MSMSRVLLAGLRAGSTFSKAQYVAASFKEARCDSVHIAGGLPRQMLDSIRQLDDLQAFNIPSA